MYDKYIDLLEDADTEAFTEDQQEALNEAMDCLATVSGLNNAMVANGFRLPENPDLNLIENAIDSLMLELLAAVMMLCQVDGAEDRLRKVAEELAEAAKSDKVDPQMSAAYAKLADRISKSKIAVDNLEV